MKPGPAPAVDPMALALAEAEAAAARGEVPVGAVLVDGTTGEVLARAGNRVEELADPTAHAEMLVLSSRAREIESWRLGEHTLVVTLEPCAMCAGASVLARVDRIVYGAADLKAGAVWSLYNIPQDRRLNHRVDVVDGVLGAECASLLSGYFDALRRP